LRDPGRRHIRHGSALGLGRLLHGLTTAAATTALVIVISIATAETHDDEADSNCTQRGQANNLAVVDRLSAPQGFLLLSSLTLDILLMFATGSDASLPSWYKMYDMIRKMTTTTAMTPAEISPTFTEEPP
jgi:hypothetical protein